MANVATAAILTRIREVVDGAAGDLRTISAARFSKSYHQEQTPDEQARQAIHHPAMFDVRVTSMERHPSTPPVSGGIALYLLEVELKSTRFLSVEHAIIASLRDTVLAAAMVDADMVAQALTYPGNLATTAAGTATGLCSGCLIFDSSESEILTGKDGNLSVASTTHRFHGYANVSLETSTGNIPPNSIASCTTWLRSDLGITLNGGSVSGWADQVGSASGSQGTSSAQPAYLGSDPVFSDLPSLTFDGTSDGMPLGATSDFVHNHNGTGGSIWIVFRTPSTHANATIFDSCNTTGGNVGMYMYQADSGVVSLSVTSGAAAVWNSNAMSLSTSTTYQVLITYSTAAGYQIFRNGSSVDSGAQANAPSVANATHPLTLGRRAGIADTFYAGKIVELASFSTVLGASDRTGLFAYSSNRYGV